MDTLNLGTKRCVFVSVMVSESLVNISWTISMAEAFHRLLYLHVVGVTSSQLKTIC